MSITEWVAIVQVAALLVSAGAVVLLVWRISVTLPQEQERLRSEVLDLRITTDQAHQKLETELARVRGLVEQVPPVVVKKLSKVLPTLEKGSKV